MASGWQEEVVAITMNKYRKGQQMLDDAERRADAVEKNITVVRGGISGVSPAGARHGGRSMSVTREVTRVVRV